MRCEITYQVVTVRYFVKVAVHTNIEESAPVQVQSAVCVHPSPTVTDGAVVSLEDHMVTDTVSIPAVESDATGRPLIVAGERLTLASQVEFWSVSEMDSG